MDDSPAVFVSQLALLVNGKTHQVGCSHHWTLLDVLREELGLTGAKRACDRGECGACTVLLDDQPVYSCQLLAMQVKGRRVLTIEGLAPGDELHPVQQAFLDNDGGQCGFCSPGFVLAAKALLGRVASPTEEEIRYALSGNLCRCNAYGRIMESVLQLAGRGDQGEAGPP